MNRAFVIALHTQLPAVCTLHRVVVGVRVFHALIFLSPTRLNLLEGTPPLGKFL